MKQEANDAKTHGEVGNGAEENNRIDDPIKTLDSSRSDEKDKRISEEKSAKWIRSQRQSTKETQKNRHRPLL